MYQLLEKKQWATSLFYCHPESCILAHILPCHIYAKIYDEPEGNSCYLFNFLHYKVFMLHNLIQHGTVIMPELRPFLLYFFQGHPFNLPFLKHSIFAQ
jgi:hypothetical protein